MKPDLTSLYFLMLKSRLYEEAIADLWDQGLISGEMHLGTGEEAITAGICSQLIPGDAMALDHRGTAPLLMVGTEPDLILKELLGLPDGLCGGNGGHMHLFSKEHLAASSGIVGAAGPIAVGFALAAQYLRPENVAVAFFGEGAMNQGMLMESLNLASVWKLPIIFVCKDDQWSITTPSKSMTGGELCERAEGLGVHAISVDGKDVEAVWTAASVALDRARSGQGPTFIKATCIHLEGHFLGYQLIRALRSPIRMLPKIIIPLVKTFFQKGANLWERLAGMKVVTYALTSAIKDPRRDSHNDPLKRLRSRLAMEQEVVVQMENDLKNQVLVSISAVLKGGVR